MFWGLEVKHGVSLHVNPGEDTIVIISNAALGEKQDNGNEPVRLDLTVGDQKLCIGTLSHDRFPQLSTRIVLERGFELSHSWSNGSVFFSGYKEGPNQVEAEPSDVVSGPNQVEAEPLDVLSGPNQVPNNEEVFEAEPSEELPTLFSFDSNQNHVSMSFTCICAVPQTIRLIAFRLGSYFCYFDNPLDGQHDPHVVINWVRDHASVVCTCIYCNTGCRFLGVRGRSSRFQLIRT